jgi:hypothetical protein
MKASILNSRNEQFSRLDGLQSAINSLLEEIERLSAFSQSVAGPPLRVFAYAFGLSVQPATVDLFKVLEIGEGVERGSFPREVEDEIEAMKADFERRLERDAREVAISLMGSRAYRLLSMSRAEAESVVRQEIEEHIRSHVAGRAIRLAAETDLTFTFAELTRRWAKMRTGIGASNQLLGGSTPMCECLRLVKKRFDRERALAPPDSKYILFIVSDGESSDGDPRAAARVIEESGVQIVSCFVTDSDRTDSKRLYSESAPGWNSGARAMFDIASRAPEGSAELDYLEKAGWQIAEPEAKHESLTPAEAPESTVDGGGLFASIWRLLGRQGTRSAQAPAPPPTASRKNRATHQVKMFAQVNHSDHLEEFIKVILTPIQLEHQV